MALRKEASVRLGMAFRRTAAETYQMLAHRFGLLTHRLRVLPDFIVIGVQKGGTTALYKALRSHPQVRMAVRKEVHYFDNHYSQGLHWYRSFFPTQSALRIKISMTGQKQITGEASPGYIFHPLAAKRVQENIPDTKFILMLRNPADRAYAHYQHSVRHGREELGFEQAIAQEADRLAGEEQAIRRDVRYHPMRYIRYSYLARGMYAKQLHNWLPLFPRSQFLILKSETFFSDPRSVLQQVADYLGIHPFKSSSVPAPYSARYKPMDDSTRRRLVDFFQPQNARLINELGVNINWEDE